jgi:hypothetical protein
MEVMWLSVGLAIGVAAGYDDIKRQVKKRMKKLYDRNKIRITDENGNEIPYNMIIKVLLANKFS